MPIAPGVKLGEGVTIRHPELVNLYGCEVGDHTRIGAFVEVQKGVRIGARCKISSHTFVCEGVTIEDEVFVGHGVMFVLEGCRSRPDLEARMDWGNKGRVLVLEKLSTED